MVASRTESEQRVESENPTKTRLVDRGQHSEAGKAFGGSVRCRTIVGQDEHHEFFAVLAPGVRRIRLGRQNRRGFHAASLPKAGRLSSSITPTGARGRIALGQIFAARNGLNLK
jgi:hypothetical protein